MAVESTVVKSLNPDELVNDFEASAFSSDGLNSMRVGTAYATS